MSRSISISDQELVIKEHQNQRVVTLEDIDRVHNRPKGTAKRNFNANKKRLITGEDYFVRNSYEAKKELGVVAPNGLTLITESGYLMLVKSFTDDLAWTVQRQLVNSYFRAKELVQPQPTTTPLSYYQGKPVMLLKEIAVVLNKSVWTVRHHIHKLKENVDYLVLSGRSLMEFKVENSHISERIHAALTIVFESGIRKLASALALDAPVLDSRLTLLPVAKPMLVLDSSEPYKKLSAADLIRLFQEEYGEKPKPSLLPLLLLFEEYGEVGYIQGFNECRQLYEPGAPALR